MTDFSAARRMMVDGQVRTSDVTDLRIIAAMLEVPRERFVPPADAALAHLDLDVPCFRGSRGEPVRRLLKPMVLAKMIQAAAVTAVDRVLDVGCATGYSSAVLARLARSVVALEEDDVLARLAGETLSAVGPETVTVVTGPLTAGWPAQAPYDVILLNGATEIVPRELTPAARGRRANGGGGGTRTRGAGDALPVGQGRRQRAGDLRCRRAPASGVRRTARVRVLDAGSGRFPQAFHRLGGVARKHQGGLFAGARGIYREGSPIMVMFHDHRSSG